MEYKEVNGFPEEIEEKPNSEVIKKLRKLNKKLQLGEITAEKFRNERDKIVIET